MSITPDAAPLGQLPPLVSADDTHQRASVIIATSVLLFSALLFVGARLRVRLNPDDEQTGGGRTAVPTGKTPLGFDDLLVVISTVNFDLILLNQWRLLANFWEGFGDDERTNLRCFDLMKSSN